MELVTLKKNGLKALKIAGWFMAGILCLLVLMVLALGVTLSFPASRVSLVEFVVNQVNERVAGIDISVNDISSPGINTWQIASLEVFLKQQLWVNIENLHLSYEVKPLLDRKLVVNYISASSIAYHHREMEGAEEKQSKEESGWPQDPWRYHVEHFEVGRLSLEGLPGGAEGKLNQLPDYTLEGNIDLFGDAAPIKLNLEAESLTPEPEAGTSTEQFAAMRIDIETHVNTDSSVTIRGNIFEAAAGEQEATSQGLISRTLQLPQTQEVDLGLALDFSKKESTYLVVIRQLDFPFQQQQVKINGKVSAALDPLDVHVEEGRILTGEQLHTVSGTLRDKTISAAISLDQFPLSLVSHWVPQIGAGQVTSQTEVGGTLDNPDIRTNSNIVVNWKGVDENIQLNAQVDGSYLSRVLQLNKLEASVKPDETSATALKAKGTWNLNDQVIDMRVGVNNLSYDLVNSISKEIPLPELPDLHATVNSADIHLTGSTAKQFAETFVDAELDGDLVYRDQPISLTARAEGSLDRWNIQVLRIRSGDNQIVAEGFFDLRGPDNALKVKLDSIAVDFLRSLDLPVPPDLKGSIDGAVALSGPIKNPAVEYQLDAGLRYPVPDAQSQLKEEDLALVASGSWSDKSIQVDNLSLTYSGFSTREPVLDATGQVNLVKKIPGMRWKINSNRIPMSLLTPYGWPDNNGELTLNLNVSVPTTDNLSSQWFESVDLDGNAFYSTRVANPTDKKSMQPVEWSLQLSSRNSESESPLWTLDSEVSIAKQGGSGNGNFSRSGQVKVKVQPKSLYRFFGDRSQLPETEVEAEFDIASLSFLWPREHQLTGIFRTDLTVSGSLDAPEIDGPLTLSSGTYVNSSLGLYFADITLNARTENQALEIDAFNAIGRDSGKLSANGRINWQEPDNAVSLDIQINEFNLVQRQDVEGQVNADMQLLGSFNRLVLSGKVEVSPLEVSIAGNPGPSIPEIDYEFASDAEEDPEATQRGGLMPTLVLDLTVNVDQQAYIRGRGLEAELEGNIDLQGPVSNLDYEGEFKTIRGEFVVFGKRFELQQGEVGFNNQSTIILVDGLYKEDDAEIRAQISGAGSELKLNLTSVPPLPEDEILARLIFGKSAQDISPIQALQLARAVQTLRGGSGGFDPIGSTREILGVDTLTVDTGKGGGLEVGAGKYLSDDVYLELERSSDPAHPWRGNVLIELTPNFSLESTTGGSGQQGASARLIWKKDY